MNPPIVSLSINNVGYTIRYPVIEDAPLLLKYINTLSQEQTFITFQGEQQTLEQERDYISGMLSAIKHQRGIELIIETNGEIVGNADVNLKLRSENHVGVLGISIAKNYRDQGLGKVYLNTLIAEASHMLPSLKIITLTVLANNDRAIHLYKSAGFIEFGRLPNGTHYQGRLTDLIYMYKEV